MALSCWPFPLICVCRNVTAIWPLTLRPPGGLHECEQASSSELEVDPHVSLSQRLVFRTMDPALWELASTLMDSRPSMRENGNNSVLVRALSSLSFGTCHHRWMRIYRASPMASLGSQSWPCQHMGDDASTPLQDFALLQCRWLRPMYCRSPCQKNPRRCCSCAWIPSDMRCCDWAWEEGAPTRRVLIKDCKVETRTENSERPLEKFILMGSMQPWVEPFAALQHWLLTASFWHRSSPRNLELSHSRFLKLRIQFSLVFMELRPNALCTVRV